jgi:CubicO group peptidase (beta-lactamase class C family)
LILSLIVSLLASSFGVEAATKLSIAVAGEPWKDPSTSAVGPALTIANPPAGTPPSGGTLAIGWSTTATTAMGVTWQVKKGSTIVASGNAPLKKVALPNTTIWIFIPASFLAKKPPTTPVTFDITVTPHDAANKPVDTTSPAVAVTQVVDTSTGPSFGANAVFPTLAFVSYVPNFGGVSQTQLFYELGTLTVRASNGGKVDTNAMRLFVTDLNGTMQQTQGTASIKALKPGHSIDVAVHLQGVLPPAQSQAPEEQQYTEWLRKYAEECGVDFRAAMDLDMSDPQAKNLVNGHSEADLYRGIGSSDNIPLVKSEVPLCDAKLCVSMTDVAANVRSQLASKAVGYAFFLAGCSIRSEAYGSARTKADNQTNFTPSTKMTVASVSKVVTALAAIRVIAERQKTDPSLKKGLDSVIGSYLPTWNWGNEEQVASITFRQLLSETSGVRNYGDFDLDYGTLKKFFSKPVATGNGPCGDKSNKDVDAVDPAIVTDKKTPCYSNINFAIFRILLPRVMGYAGDDETEYAKRYVQIVQDKVFAPLGITDVDCDAPKNDEYALAYVFPGDKSGHDFGDQRKFCGGAGWYLSVEDLGKVLLSLNGADGRILTNAEFRDMEDNPAVHAVGWDCPSNCASVAGDRWMEKNGLFEVKGAAPLVTTSIAIFGGANKTPYLPGAVGVLFVNSDIANLPNSSASTVLSSAFANAAKPKK